MRQLVIVYLRVVPLHQLGDYLIVPSVHCFPRHSLCIALLDHFKYHFFLCILQSATDYVTFLFSYWLLGKKELNELAIKMALGVDKVVDEYLVSAQVVVPGEHRQMKGGTDRSPVTLFQAKREKGTNG